MQTDNCPVFYNQTFDKPPVPYNSKAIFVNCKVFECKIPPSLVKGENKWSAFFSIFDGREKPKTQ